MNTRIAHIMRSAGLLGLVAVLGTGLLAGIYHLTKDRIAEQQRRAVLAQLHQVFPDALYNNELHEDFIDISDAGFFRHADPVRIYRARMNGNDAGVVMNLIAPDGYNGDIRLLAGIDSAGVITGVRVIEHRETPGLGDPIDISRSPWITGFDGRSLTNPEPVGWTVKKDGGIYDQFTGATITPRAVVAAVERALVYFDRNKDVLFERHMEAGE